MGGDEKDRRGERLDDIPGNLMKGLAATTPFLKGRREEKEKGGKALTTGLGGATRKKNEQREEAATIAIILRLLPRLGDRC